MNKQIEDCYNNLINGNLKDAKKQAKRFGVHKLIQEFMESGIPREESEFHAGYLKGIISYNRYSESLELLKFLNKQ